MLVGLGKRVGVIGFLVALCSGVIDAAPHENRKAEQEHAWEISALLGVGERYNPLVGRPENKHNLTGDINLSYYGERFFVDDGVGYTLFSDNHLMVNLIANANEDFILFEEAVFDTNIPELEGLRKRKATFDGGIEVLFDGMWGEVEFQAETDLLGHHKGQLVDANYAYTFKFDRLEIRPQIGFIWKSENYVDYYYGVSSAEVKPDRVAYEGKSSLDWVAIVEVKYALANEWNAVGWVYYEQAGAGIGDSPLLEKNHYLEYVLGLEWVRPFSFKF